MSNARKQEYLEAKVTTASPAQLHLMLIEGALRFGREAEKAMLRDDLSTANPLALRMLAVVEELIAGVRHSDDELNEKLARLYEFVFARVTSSYVNGDHQMMAEAIRVLEFERETWRMACERAAMSSEDAPLGEGVEASKKAHKKPAAPHLGTTPATEGLQIEA